MKFKVAEKILLKESMRTDSEALADEERLYTIENMIDEWQDKIDDGFDNPDGRRMTEKQIDKLQDEKQQIINREKSESVLTTIDEILSNLDKYRRCDLVSLGNQISRSNWNGIDGKDFPISELKLGIKEMLEEVLEENPLNGKVKSQGFYVRKPLATN